MSAQLSIRISAHELTEVLGPVIAPITCLYRAAPVAQGDRRERATLERRRG